MSAAAGHDAAFRHVRFISAGAGSGKTYRLTEELERALLDARVEPAGVIGTTFTVKAAAELGERVRIRLIRSGHPQLAEQLEQALIGTVHSVCERLLRRFAFELGLSPELAVVSVEDSFGFFRQALDDVLSVATVREMNSIAARFGIEAWQDDVRRIADAARSNNVEPAALAQMGRHNAEELAAFFPPAEHGAWDEQLLTAVRDALHAIDTEADTTKKTAGYVAALRTAIWQLRRGGCPWSAWMSLSKAAAAKRSEPLAARVRAAAAHFEQHPRFAADLRRYVEAVFAIASKALERFRALKTERGLIDFADMEQLTLAALDDAGVRERLGGTLELLLVDEFQDTNPMQLAIFMKLASLAREVIFVGDVKQAIYAFRGCDPDLVFETLAALAGRGGQSDRLEHSWRARPALVSFTNAVFTDAFAGEIEAEQIHLRPMRSETSAVPAVFNWSLAGNATAQAAALADGIRRLVGDGHEIADPDSGRPRPASWGDVAVLAATNRHVEDIARALRAANVPMKMTLKGLLEVAEVCLARACLRRLNDFTDTLATAEILALTDCASPEVWLEDRLRWLAGHDEPYAWAEQTHPVVAQLAALREQTATQSPVEIVARVLNYVGLRRIVTAWGPNAMKAAQRQRNLDALLNLAVEYERHCDAQHVAATLTGFLFWLENPHSPELDLQPVVTTGDAVHVLTYHKSKGLEWPIVVAAGLHFEWPSRLWDVRVDNAGADFDLHAPLADRHIRFWPRIFGNHGSGIPALERLLASAEGQRCRRRGEAETRRVAYVGLTRARDALVLALPAGKPRGQPWIAALRSRYLPPREERVILADGGELEVPAATLGQTQAPLAPPDYAPRWFVEREPLAAASRRETISPSQLQAAQTAGIEASVTLGARLPLAGDDMTVIGRALHAVLAAELIRPSPPGDPTRTAAILAGHRAADFIDAADALRCAESFRRWVDAEFTPRRVLVEHPVSHRLDDGCVVRGWIDVLLETPAGWVVIDHKSSPRPRSEWPAEAAEHAGQLAAYAAALEAAGRPPVAACWIHLPVGGGAIRVALPSRQATSGSA